MKIILDTSFILTCLKEKLDFLDASGFGEIVIPEQVILELKKLNSGNSKESSIANLALDIINKNKKNIKVISLDKKYADAGIKDYIKKNRNVILATLDRELKKLPVKILTIRGKKIELI